MATGHPNGNPHAQGSTWKKATVSVAKKGFVTLQTTTPSDIETEIAALRKGREVRICTEPKLAIHPIPNQHQDHSAEHLRRGLPDYFSGVGGCWNRADDAIEAYTNLIFAHWFGCWVRYAAWSAETPTGSGSDSSFWSVCACASSVLVPRRPSPQRPILLRYRKSKDMRG
jgi:hypothetical protein